MAAVNHEMSHLGCEFGCDRTCFLYSRFLKKNCSREGKGTQVHFTMNFLVNHYTDLWAMPFQTETDKIKMAAEAFDFFNYETFQSQLYQNFDYTTGSWDETNENYIPHEKDHTIYGVTIPSNIEMQDGTTITDLDHCVIDLNLRSLSTRDLLIGTVAHEMCHFAAMYIDRYDDPAIECHEHGPYLAWRSQILNEFPFLDFDDDHHGYPIIFLD